MRQQCPMGNFGGGALDYNVPSSTCPCFPFSTHHVPCKMDATNCKTLSMSFMVMLMQRSLGT
jgi:hypothetical protein